MRDVAGEARVSAPGAFRAYRTSLTFVCHDRVYEVPGIGGRQRLLLVSRAAEGCKYFRPSMCTKRRHLIPPAPFNPTVPSRCRPVLDVFHASMFVEGN